MIRAFTIILGLLLAGPVLAHSDTSFTKGPNGGHIVDAGKQHWELVANGKTLTLYVSDADEAPITIKGGKATAQILVGGKSYLVEFAPAGGNAMTASGEFTAAKGMKVIVKTENVGGQSASARLTPLQ